MAAHVAAVVQAEDEAGRRIAATFGERCRGDEWSADVRRCLVETQSMSDPRNCRQLLSFEQTKRLDAALVAAERALSKETLPQACVDYEKLVAAVARCEKAPPELRESLAAQLAEAQAQWATLPDKSTVGEVCRSANAAVRQVVPASCGP